LSAIAGKAALRFIQRIISQLEVDTVKGYVDDNFDLVDSIINGNWEDHDRLRKLIAKNLKKPKVQKLISEWDINKYLEEYLQPKSPELYNYFKQDIRGRQWLKQTRKQLLAVK